MAVLGQFHAFEEAQAEREAFKGDVHLIDVQQNLAALVAGE